MNLQDLVNSFSENLTAKNFRDGAFRSILFNTLEILFIVIIDTFFDRIEFLIQKTGKAIYKGFGGKNLGRKVRNFLRNRPKLSDRGVKLLTFIGIFDTVDQCTLCSTCNTGPKLETTNIQDIKGNFMSSSFFTQYVFHRYFTVVEDDLGS